MMVLAVVGDVDLVHQLLLLAGDVETNPGPVPPGMLKSLVNDLKSIKQHKYKSFGLKLLVPPDVVQVVVEQFKGDSVRILTEIINEWLNYLQEEGYAEMFVNKDKQVDRICLTMAYSKQDYIDILCRALREIEESNLAVMLKKKCEQQQRLLQSLRQELSSVQDKYFNIGVELEVGLAEIYQLEAKYLDNKAKIFSEVLQWWMDNCSRSDYICDICSALEAVGESDLAKDISKKYSQIDESPPATPPGMEDEIFLKDNQQPNPQMDGEAHPSKIINEKRKVSSNSHVEIPAGKKIREHSVDSLEMSPLADAPMNLESVDGRPQTRQQLLGSSEVAKVPAKLVITAPEGTPLNNLKDLNHTMETTGDKRFPLSVNGRLSNTPWSLIDWQIIPSTVKLATTVDVTMSLSHHRTIVPIAAGVRDKLTEGVTEYVSEALNKQYTVNVTYSPN